MSNDAVEVTVDNVFDVCKREFGLSDVFLIKADNAPHALMIATWMLRSRSEVQVRFEGISAAQFADAAKTLGVGIERAIDDDTEIETYAVRFL